MSERPEGATGARVRVLALPAFRNRSVNPYNALLYTAVERLGPTVDEVSPRQLVGLRHDVVHIHWPEYVFDAPGTAKAVAKSLAFALVLTALRRRHTKVVWTIHNLAAHDQWHGRWAGGMWRWFANRVDGYIALSAGGQAAALQRFPMLRRRPGFVIPHGHYRGEYPDSVTREGARAALALPAAAKVVVFVGAIRPYKNVPMLLEAFRLVPGADWRLVVAGQPATPALAADLVARAADDGRVRVDLAFVPRELLQVYLRAADLVVLPYRDVLNSGSAMLALSFDRPVLVPARGAMAELRERVGAEWVCTYEGELTPSLLTEAMDWAGRAPHGASKRLDDLGWDEIARQTVRAYEAVR